MSKEERSGVRRVSWVPFLFAEEGPPDSVISSSESSSEGSTLFALSDNPDAGSNAGVEKVSCDGFVEMFAGIDCKIFSRATIFAALVETSVNVLSRVERVVKLRLIDAREVVSWDWR